MSWTLDLSQPVELGHPLNAGRVGWWRTEIGSGAQLRNIMPGDRFHGTLTGFGEAGRPWRSTGRGDFDLLLNGTSSYLDCGTSVGGVVLRDTPGFCLSGSFRVNVFSSWQSIATKVNAAGNNRQFFLGISGGYSVPTNGFTLFTGFAGDGAVGTNALVAGRDYWFFAAHYGAGAGGNRLWVWSQQRGWEAIVAGSASPGNTAIDADSGVNPVRWGYHTPGGPFLLNGSISDLSLSLDGNVTSDFVCRLHEQSLRGYRTPDSPLRWIRGITTVFPPVIAASNLFQAELIPGLGL